MRRSTSATYTKDDGWTPVSEADMEVSAVDTSVTAAGKAKATLGAKASVGLYGAVGVNAELAPYVRATAESDLVRRTYSWATYGGYDLTGTLEAPAALDRCARPGPERGPGVAARQPLRTWNTYSYRRLPGIHAISLCS